MYAGVLFTVGEVLGGALAMATFDMSSYFPLVKRLEIDFLKPARSDVRASTSLRQDEIERVRAAAEETGKGQFELVAELHDQAGMLVARTVGIYQIRRL
jgi:acyl-coenzyme A thioesterase PaaI-like protein